MLQSVWALFASLLDRRFVDRVYTTEDSVRYTFFAALLSSGYYEPTHIVLELPHPTIHGAEIDTFIAAQKDRPALAIEFKYDRPIPSQRNLPRTQKAGQVFKDIFRLAHVPTTTAEVKYFVYLTDQEMASYFQNPRNGLLDFYDLRTNQAYMLSEDHFHSLAHTFRQIVQLTYMDCSVVGVFGRELALRHSLRIYEISSLRHDQPAMP